MTTRMRRLQQGVPLLLALFFGAAPEASAATSCSVSGANAGFSGNYNPQSSAPLDGFFWVDVSCSKSDVVLTLSASTGWGTYSQRRLMSGSNWLAYNIYTSPSGGQVLGDGFTAGTATMQTFTSYWGTAAFQATMKIAPLQNVAPGTYGDVITITVSY